MCELIRETFQVYLKCYLSTLLSHFVRLLLVTLATKQARKQNKRKPNEGKQRTEKRYTWIQGTQR